MSEPREFELTGPDGGAMLQGAETLPQAVHLAVGLVRDRDIEGVRIWEEVNDSLYDEVSEDRITPFLTDECRARNDGDLGYIDGVGITSTSEESAEVEA